MGEHPSLLGDVRYELNEAALEMWADGNGVSRSAVLADPELLARFVAWDRDFVAAVEAGLADIREGRIVSHEDMLAHAAERRRRFLESRA